MITMRNKKMLAPILFFLIGFTSVAQGNGTPPPPRPPPPPGLPIDSGIIVLFVVGLIYGIYKVRQLSKKPT